MGTLNELPSTLRILRSMYQGLQRKNQRCVEEVPVARVTHRNVENFLEVAIPDVSYDSDSI